MLFEHGNDPDETEPGARWTGSALNISPVLASAAAAAALWIALVALMGLHWPWTLLVVPGLLTAAALGQPARSDTDDASRESSTEEAGEAARDGRKSDLWHRVLTALPDAALLLDRNGNVLAANAEARTLLNVVERRHISLVMRSPDLLEAVEAALASGKPQTCRPRILTKSERHMTGHVTPVADPPPASGPALLIVLRDATDEHQLARLRADFVANASHELRTPLASLKGFIETLQGAARNDAAARERFLPIMHQQATRMAHLIDDLLSLSIIEMREHVAPRDTVDLAAVARQATTYLEPLADEAEVTLHLAPPPGGTFVVGDQDELVQVAQNLIQNAIKYGRKGGRVDVSVAREGSRVALTVTDDGIGIAPEHLPRLTERFYRVSAKDSRERGGTGLGLAIVKHILNRHHGDLRVTSRMGEGSTFRVLLPSAP